VGQLMTGLKANQLHSPTEKENLIGYKDFECILVGIFEYMYSMCVEQKSKPESN